jgi:hypothetical protein
VGETPNGETLATIASLVATAGAATLLFRIQREIVMEQQQQRIWIAGADWLMIGATLVAIVLALLPLLFFYDSELGGRRIPTAACTASLAAMGGYSLGILAHYRLLFGKGRSGDREPTEPAELVIILVTVAVAVFLFGASLISTA